MTASDTATPRTPPTPPSPPPPQRPRGSRPLGLGLALIGLGALWLLSALGVDISWDLVLPAAVVLVGLLILAGGRRPARDGLIGLGVLLAVVALVVSVLPGPVAFSAGERNHIVTTTADLEADYTLGMGTLTLDLRDLELPAGRTEVTAGVGMGELRVIVPADAEVSGDAAVTMGEVAALGRTSSGVGPNLTLSDDAAAGAPVLDLDLEVGLGRIEVTRATR